MTDTVKFRKSQFYTTNHKSHQNAMYLTAEGVLKEYAFAFFMTMIKIAVFAVHKSHILTGHYY